MFLQESDSVVIYNCGSTKAEMCRFREAIQDLGGSCITMYLTSCTKHFADKSIELAPKLAVAFRTRGAAKEELCLHEEALDDFNKALALRYNSKNI